MYNRTLDLSDIYITYQSITEYLDSFQTSLLPDLFPFYIKKETSVYGWGTLTLGF